MSNSDPSTRDIIATRTRNKTLTRPPFRIFCTVLRPFPFNSLTSHPHLLGDYVFFFHDKRPLIRTKRHYLNCLHIKCLHAWGIYKPTPRTSRHQRALLPLQQSPLCRLKPLARPPHHRSPLQDPDPDDQEDRDEEVEAVLPTHPTLSSSDRRQSRLHPKLPRQTERLHQTKRSRHPRRLLHLKVLLEAGHAAEAEVGVAHAAINLIDGLPTEDNLVAS